MEYHEICLWLPYKQETVEDIANDMLTNGYRPNHPIVTYEGKILDGRHRYEAAKEVGLEPEYEVFEGTTQEAISFVTSENVNRRHLSNQEKKFFYAQVVEVTGVRDRGAPEGNNNRNGGETKAQNCTFEPPSSQDHADSLGVHVNTVKGWEKDRKEIVADPELKELAKTPDGYKQAEAVVKDRRSKAEILREQISNMTPEEQVEHYGGPKKVIDQKALDQTLDEDFNPYHAALAVLSALRRLHVHGKEKSVGSNILHALDTSTRFQPYEAEALLCLAKVVEDHKTELEAMCLQKVDLNKLN